MDVQMSASNSNTKLRFIKPLEHKIEMSINPFPLLRETLTLHKKGEIKESKNRGNLLLTFLIFTDIPFQTQ